MMNIPDPTPPTGRHIPPAATQSAFAVVEESTAEQIGSRLQYVFRMRRNRAGLWVPMELGQGKFARVFKGELQIAGQPARAVAIKVLHSQATVAHERLFETEIAHMRALGDTDGVNVVRIFDVIPLGPLLLCGCGRVYHPRCPSCGKAPLERTEIEEHTTLYPALTCPKCSETISASQIMTRAQALHSKLARVCCHDKGAAAIATILNFADRGAIVMEQIPLGLKDFAERRRAEVREQLRAKGVDLGALSRRPAMPRALAAVSRWLPARLAPDSSAEVIEKVLLLEKVKVVAQLAEAVAWLHGDKQVVHKDLAADNVMVRLEGARGAGDWRGEGRNDVRVQDLLHDLASATTFRATLIDFGFADANGKQRSWYDQVDVAGENKKPFLSPEARHRRRDFAVQRPIEFDAAQKSFEIPEVMRSKDPRDALMAGDVLSYALDLNHTYDIEITDVQGTVAKYQGVAPDLKEIEDFPRFFVERPLLEPHDIYGLGALFYFLLTEDNNNFERLHSLADSVERFGRPVITPSLRGRDHYLDVRDAIRSPYWRDELLVIILRALTRGLPGSYAKSRIDRGPRPAQRFMLEVKRMRHVIERDINTSTLWRR